VVEADTPVLVTVVREINEPRIPTLMNIMKAKKKPITEWNLHDLSLRVDELKASVKVRVTDIKAPEVKRKKIAVKADKMEKVVSKLLEYLISEGVLEA
jgi:electron transfer flavoprotein beta subunit